MAAKNEKNKKVEKKFKSVNSRAVNRIKKSPAFGNKRDAKFGREIYRFRTPGDTVQGMIGKPIRYARAQSCYPVMLDDKTIIEIPGNQQLARTIRKNQLVGEYCRIRYEGKMATAAGHYRKIYHVEKLQKTRDTKSFIEGLRKCLSKKELENLKKAATASTA